MNRKSTQLPPATAKSAHGKPPHGKPIHGKSHPARTPSPRAPAGAASSAAEPHPEPEWTFGPAHDPSDIARDQRLRNELAVESARSPADRHRERLTAIEAEEDDVHGDDDDEDTTSELREQALKAEDADEQKDERP